MSASRAHRRTGRGGAPLGRPMLIAALVMTAISSSLHARAQDSWVPVVVATAPPHDPATVDTPSRAKPRPASRAASAPAPLAPKSGGMPPLATIAAQTATAVAPERRPAPAEPPEADAKMAREYCNNIVDAASDARFAWQKKVIGELEQEVAKRVEVLEAKTAEYQRWLARRDEFSKRAQETVVTIYARMKPEAAAAQLVAMDEETAAAVLTKLDPRNASAILSEMEPTQAARLTATISGASNVNLPGRAKPQPGEKKS
jgi:flagellar motility protein MotE (MotC chaperone)